MIREINLQRSISAFWLWFAENLRNLYAPAEDSQALKELDRLINAIDTKLSWEIGPGTKTSRQLVISPNLNRELLDVVRFIISSAPAIDDWEFFVGRQPKAWGYTFELLSQQDGRRFKVDASSWTFVLLRYPDASRECLLCGQVSELPNDQRSIAAAIALESILGEELLMQEIDDFELVSEFDERFVERQRPIQEIAPAIRAGLAKKAT